MAARNRALRCAHGAHRLTPTRSTCVYVLQARGHHGRYNAATVCKRVRVGSRHDRLMQTYDVMRFDINIFPLIRQIPGPPPHACDPTDGKTVPLV